MSLDHRTTIRKRSRTTNNMKIVLTATGSSQRSLTIEQRFTAYEEIHSCLRGAVNTFQKEILMLTGCADGIDQYAGLACIDLGIPWIICVPEKKYQIKNKKLQDQASDIIAVGFNLEERDQYMISKSDIIIACVKRGSKKTKFIKNANDSQKQIVFLRI